MSKTFKDTTARKVRMMNRDSLDAFNSGDADLSRRIFRDMDELETDGVRYGNHRKQKAKEKVVQRRADRRAKKGSTEDLYSY